MPVETRIARTMMLRIRGFFPFILLLLGLAPSAVGSAATDAALTQEERDWIAKHPIVRLMPDPLFPPFEYFDEDGTYRGIGAEYVALLEKKVGIRFEVIWVKDWQESVARTKRRENDAWSVVASTPQRAEYMLFTKPYIESPAVIVVRSDVKRRLTVDDLKGMKVTISSGYAVHDTLKRRYPDMAFDPVPDPLTGLKKVSFGMADAMVVNVALASHLMEKAAISNLRMAGEVGYTYRWGFASRDDWPQLYTILEKGLAQITPEERQAITRKWVALKDQPWAPSRTFVLLVLGVLAVLVIGTVLAWNRSLKRRINMRTWELAAELAERERAEVALRKRAELIQLLRRMANDANKATTLEDAARDALANVCTYNEWPVGHAYVLSAGRPHLLVPSGIWHLADGKEFSAFRMATEKTSFEAGIGLPGRVMASGEPAWIVDVTKDSNFPRAKLADDIGVKAGFALPVLSGLKVVAVLEFFSPDAVEPDQTLLDSLVQVGTQLGRVYERERAEKDLRASQAALETLNQQKNKLFSILAHDLRSPFNALLGLSELLALGRDTYSRAELVKYSKSINDSGHRLFQLLENLLEWSRSQMDQITFEPEPQELDALVGQSLSLLSGVAEEKNVRLVNEVPKLTVQADRHMADTVIRNLLTNAIKFTEEMGSITISAQRKNGSIETTVADTGIGMAPDRLASIFLIGSTQSSRGTRGEAGTGLGLLLCKDFVERHGGTIDAESKLGEGSIFRFTLPIHRD
jgi:signal transduction histidine kinase/ABC-type amino acid transport substrate-binding protein